MKIYWTSSKFADYIRGNPIISSGTAEEWDAWRNTTKTIYPIRFWLATTFLYYLQDFVEYIPNKLLDVKRYITNRYITKTHMLTSKLPRGQWYDLDERILHCLFDELINYVEIECAWINSRDEQLKVTPWYNKSRWTRKLIEFRDSKAGLDYLKWCINECDINSNQSTSAVIILELYNWWKTIRPNRIDPYNDENLVYNGTPSEEQKLIRHNFFNNVRKIEEHYIKEDTDMLIKLITIRNTLWT